MSVKSPVTPSSPQSGNSNGNGMAPVLKEPEGSHPGIPFQNLLSVVRVRPWIKDEASVVPDKQMIPRPGLDFTPPDVDSGVIKSITVLDPANRFKPKKAGKFSADAVLWSFIDETLDSPTSPSAAASPVASPSNGKKVTPPGIPATQSDVYNFVGSPLVDCLMEGFNVGCVVGGGAHTGKHYTLIGDEYWAGEPRGIVPRFLFDLFERQQKGYREDRDAEIAVECFAINNDAITDLLRKTKSTEELKVKEDAEGITVPGATLQKVEDVLALEPVLKAAVQRQRKHHKGSHLVITMKLTDLWSFQDPTSPEATIKKQRKSFATFVLLGGSHLGFQRCIDAAISRDGGDHPNAKIPSRDSHFTRLLAEIFGGNCNVAYVNCVSPYYDHTKDAMNTLALAARLNVIKCHAKHNTDNSMNELRKLDDEMRGLQMEVQKTNESMTVVQEELDRRTDALRESQQMAVESKRVYDNMDRERTKTERMKTATTVRVKHAKRNKAEDEKRLISTKNAKNKEEETLNAEADALIASTEAGVAAIAALEVKMAEQRERTAATQEKVDNYTSFEDEVNDQDDIVKSSGTRKKAIENKHKERMSELTEEKKSHEARLAPAEAEVQELEPGYKETSERYDFYKSQEKELKALEDDIKKQEDEEKKLEDEIAALNDEVKKLEAQQGCCVIS